MIDLVKIKFQENIKVFNPMYFALSGKNENPKSYIEVHSESLPSGEHIVVSAHDKRVVFSAIKTKFSFSRI